MSNTYEVSETGNIIPIAYLNKTTKKEELRGRTNIAVVVAAWKDIDPKILEIAKLTLVTTAMQFGCTTEDLIIKVN